MKGQVMQTHEQLLITENQIITPLVGILNEAVPLDNSISSKTKETQVSVRESLDILFPEQQYDEKNIKKAKEILGVIADEFSPVQFRDVVTEIHYLVESWLDDFEREIFDGLTLRELLHEKGSL